MPIVRTPLPHLFGGISQQPESLRLPGQLQAQSNMWSTPRDGLTPRFPTEHVVKAIDGAVASSDNLLLHTIDRDEAERYVALIRKGEVKVFGEDGTEYPVHGPTTPYTADFSYIDEGVVLGNILTNGETFTGGTWGVTTTLTINTPAGPQANPFGETSPNPAREFIMGTAVVGEARHTGPATYSTGDSLLFSIYAKRPTTGANQMDRFSLWIYFGGSISGAYFSVAGGGAITVLTNNPFPIAGHTVTSGVEDVGDGWYRCWVAVEGVDAAFDGTGRLFAVELGRTTPTAGERGWFWGAAAYEDTVVIPDYRLEGFGPFRAVTIADTSIILNTSRATAMAAERSPMDENRMAGGDHALLFVRTGGLPDTRYTVRFKIEGGVATVVTFTTGTPGPGTSNTNIDIAEALRTGLDAIAGVTATRFGSVVDIVTTAPIKKFRVEDGRGDTLMVRIWNGVEAFTDLPKVAPEGFKIRVVGQPADGLDDYYVKFTSEGEAADEILSEGLWFEDVAEDVLISLDETTMPHKLTRLQDDSVGTVTGTPDQVYFEWAPIEWDDRLVGDDLTNEAPSFVSPSAAEPKYIQDVFFFQGRLGFLSDQNVILSESNSFFNFWRTTTTAVPDSDPVDVRVSHQKVSLLHDAAPSDERLLVFSQQAAFVLDSNTGVVTPETVSITPALDYESVFGTEVVSIGRSVYFPYQNADFSGLREMFQENEVSFGSDDTSSHARKLIEGKATQVAGSALENVIAVRGDGDPNKLWVYQFFFSSNQRVQSAWSVYDFGPDSEVAGVGWIESTLWLAIQRTEGLFLEKMVVGTGRTDDDSNYVVALDRRLRDDSAGVSAVYAAGPNETTFTLPYDLEADAEHLVVTRQVLSSSDEGGAVLTPTFEGTNTIKVLGDYSAVPVFIGQRYTPTFTLSKPVLREPASGGGLQRIVQPRWQLRALELYFEDSAAFTATVQAGLRDPTSKEMNASMVGTSTTVLGSLVLADGKFRIPVLCRADDVSITVEVPGPMPVRLIGAEWEAQLRGRGARLGA
jgi:hypothetical protein